MPSRESHDPRPPLIIPAELAGREFDGKLLLACLAVKRGYRVLLGCRFDLDLHADLLPRGIRLEKGLTDASYKMFRNLHGIGCALVALDEEALVYHADEVYCRLRMSRRSADLVRLMLAWGEDNKRLWRAWDGYRGTPIAVTGNPRADLLRPELRAYFAADADRLTRAHGDFILINSNFGSVNFVESGGVSSKFARLGDGENGARLFAHRQALFHAFLDLVPRLAAQFPDRRVIVRPHPSESHAAWSEAAKGSANVQVVGGGGVPPWLMAARATIHNGCTTAVESHLLGRPAIAYRPVQSPEWDIHLPNALSEQVFTLDELMAAVRRRLGDNPVSVDPGSCDEELIAAHVAGRAGPLASDRILDALASIENPADLGSVDLGLAGLVRRWFVRRRLRRRRAKKLALLDKGRGRAGREFKRRSFPLLPVSEVAARAKRLRDVYDRLPPVEIVGLFDNVFEIRLAA